MNTMQTLRKTTGWKWYYWLYTAYLTPTLDWPEPQINMQCNLTKAFRRILGRHLWRFPRTGSYDGFLQVMPSMRIPHSSFCCCCCRLAAMNESPQRHTNNKERRPLICPVFHKTSELRRTPQGTFLRLLIRNTKLGLRMWTSHQRRTFPRTGVLIKGY